MKSSIIFLGFLVAGAMYTHASEFQPETISNDGSVISNSMNRQTDDMAPYPGNNQDAAFGFSMESGSRQLTQFDGERIATANFAGYNQRFQLENIIGTDTRSKIDPYDSKTRYSYPARATVLVTFTRSGSDFICSGAMIGPDTVLTAGHCLHGGGATEDWSTDVSVIPAYSQSTGTKTPYGVCDAKTLRTFSKWVAEADRAYDLGAIKLECKIGNRTGWYGIKKGGINKLPTIITGYPGDKPKTDQWQAVDWVRKSDRYNFQHKADTYGGMSGSPVWVDNGVGPYIIGVHTAGNSTINLATSVTQAFFKAVVSWKNQPWEDQ